MDFLKLHNFLAEHIPNEQIPGCDIMVYHKGQLVYREQFGTGDYLKAKPVNTDDHYILYSCSKVVTCAAVLHLIEEGKLGLDDPVSQYIPAFADVVLEDGSKPKTTMTIRHLLSMSAGLDYDLNAPHIRELLRNNPDANTVDIATAIAKKPIHFEPGTHYRYSLCHDVLAAVAEVITGQTFESYVKEWTGADIAYNFNDENRVKLFPQFNAESGKAIPVKQLCAYIFSKNHYSGGAGMIATAQAYAGILNDLCQGKLLKRETLELMTTNQLTDAALADMHAGNDKNPYGYGLGVRTLMWPQRIDHKAPLREFGWGGAAGSYAILDYERQIAVGYFQCVLSCAAAGDIHRGIRDRVYEALGYTFT